MTQEDTSREKYDNDVVNIQAWNQQAAPDAQLQILPYGEWRDQRLWLFETHVSGVPLTFNMWKQTKARIIRGGKPEYLKIYNSNGDLQ